MKKVNFITSVFILMAILPMVSAVTLPTSAFFCEEFGGSYDCIYAGDGDAGFGNNGVIVGGEIREWYNFTEGFGNGINISLYVDSMTSSLDYVELGCKSYNPATDFFVIANITVIDNPSVRHFTVPNNCLNPEDNQTAIFYIGPTPETTAVNRWFDSFFTELDAPSSPINATISIVYPYNITYNSTVDNLEYSVSNAQACWYSTNLGVTNNTITCGQNVTGLNANNTGSYTWIVYANNSENNLVTDSVTFNVLLPIAPPTIPNIYYTPQSPEVLFMQEAVGNPTNSNLAYDGNTTSYTGVYSGSGGLSWYIGYNWTSTVGNVINMTVVIHTYDGSSGTVNFACENRTDSTYIDIGSFSATGTEEYGDVTFYIPRECIGTWATIPDHLEFRVISDADFSVGEFLIYNNEVESPPSPEVEQEDILYTVLSSSGTGLGVFLEAIRSPLVAIILGIGVILGIVGIVYVLSSTIKNYLGNFVKGK
jgi:hypothetical protein